MPFQDNQCRACRYTGVRFLVPYLILASSAVLSLGCGLHLHDEQRLKVADEALKLAETIQAGSANPFIAMESDLDTATGARAKIDALQNELRFKTFLTAYGSMTKSELTDELNSENASHKQLKARCVQFIEAAVKAAADAMARGAILNTAPRPSQPDLDSQLKDVADRLDRLDAILHMIGSASDQLGKLDDLLPTEQKQVAEALQVTKQSDDKLIEALTLARSSLASVEKTEKVVAARQFILDAGAEIASAEKARLGEMQRHLNTLKVIQNRLDDRERLYTDRLMNPALSVVGTVTATTLSDEEKKRVRDNEDAWKGFGPRGASLIEYLERRLDPKVGEDIREGTVKAIASVGVIIGVEGPEDQRALRDIFVELHRHSIRLSQINSAERLDLIHQVVEGLQIYFQGGIKPDQVAQLLLEAAQVAALFNIADKQSK